MSRTIASTFTPTATTNTMPLFFMSDESEARAMVHQYPGLYSHCAAFGDSWAIYGV